ncbi:hypothetical protein [Stenotrophomonas sp. CFBP 13718]|uniref:hypothetical protein n=1 Tax=Stenotrophomonas sp. CFBP 13718 TaxID=2775304 RepID=UPI00177D6AD6|nr:hypothetical protein [Stenotrophomonas sp. CFBP 13718]MBD8697640.1 hypothetical protein [Stenotrophomonas sp. CFBP 13718]
MNDIDETEALFDSQLIIGPTILAGSPLLRHLHAVGEFDIDAQENWLYLPIDQAFADKLGCSRYAKEPIDPYTQGMLQQLSALEASPDGRGALEGDLGSTVRTVHAIRRLQDTVKVALINGDLVVAYSH